jgi:GNAT superfamily N-acetyltransferase
MTVMQQTRLTPIQKRHDRKAFDRGYADLNEFLAHSARVSFDRRITRTFVIEDLVDPKTIMAYITLTYTTVDLPVECKPARKLKNPVPAVFLAKMAVDNRYKGSSYGKRLLTFAIKEASETSKRVGGVGLVIDAKGNNAKAFYLSRGSDDFEIIDGSGLKLWLSLDICDAIAQALGDL